VLIEGKQITGPGIDRAMVFQEYVLIPWRTALRNVEFGLEFEDVAHEKRTRRAMTLIRLVGLEGFENHHPHELSGGMQQRVGLARALVVDPKILLMDEPFGSLDAQTREIMQSELLKIWALQRKTVIFSTHSIEEAIYLSDRIAIMSPSPGLVKEIVEVNLPRPRTYIHRVSSEFSDIRLQVWKKLVRKK
jgi:NitT/TauT family transport system ATP-binding protein